MSTPKMTVAEEERLLTDELASLRKSRRGREVNEALDAGWVVQGVRLVSPKGGEQGVTLALSAKEAGQLNEVLRKIVAARNTEAK